MSTPDSRRAPSPSPSRSSAPAAAQEAPYLTHVQRYHGQLTLTAPPNLGRKREPDKAAGKKKKKGGKYTVPEHIVAAVAQAGLPSDGTAPPLAVTPPVEQQPVASTSQTRLVAPSPSPEPAASPPTARRRRRRQPDASPAASTLSLPATLDDVRGHARGDSDNVSLHADRRIDIWAGIEDEESLEPPPPAWSAPAAAPNQPPIPASPPPTYRSPSPSPPPSRSPSPEVPVPLTEWERDRQAGLSLAERIGRERARRRESMRHQLSIEDVVTVPVPPILPMSEQRAEPMEQFVPVRLLLWEAPVQEETPEANEEKTSDPLEQKPSPDAAAASVAAATTDERDMLDIISFAEPRSLTPLQLSPPPPVRPPLPQELPIPQATHSLFFSGFSIPPQPERESESPSRASAGEPRRPEEDEIDQDRPLSEQMGRTPDESELRRRREGHRASMILSRPMSIKRAPPPVPPPRRWVPPTVIREEDALASPTGPSLRRPPRRPMSSALAYIPSEEANELPEPMTPLRPTSSVASLVDRFEAAQRRRPPPPPPRPSSHSASTSVELDRPLPPAPGFSRPPQPSSAPSKRELPRPPSIANAVPRSAFDELRARAALSPPSSRRRVVQVIERPPSPTVVQQDSSPIRVRRPSIPPLRPPSPPPQIPIPIVVAEPATSAAPVEPITYSAWTDLDLLAARTDHRPPPLSRAASSNPSQRSEDEVVASNEDDDADPPAGPSTYEPLLLLGEIMGPPPPRAEVWERERISVAPIECVRRRVSKDGRRMQKLACIGINVSRCVVCQVQFKEGNQAGIFPGCLHIFHVACLDRWLNRSRCCPTCRRDIADDSDPASTAATPSPLATPPL